MLRQGLCSCARSPPAVHPSVGWWEGRDPRALFLDCSVDRCLVLTIRKHLMVQNGLHRGSDLGRCPWPPDPMKVQEGLLAHRARL